MAEDYPSNLLEFERRFTTEDACRAYLIALRWPAGFRCPRCQSERAWAGRAGGLIIDEFTFRFNRRTSRSRGKLFYRLVQQAVEVNPVHWRDVAAGERRRHFHNRWG